MSFVVCPHCANRRIVASKVPKDVVVVLPCPACHELVVMFRHKVAALNREVLEHGTYDERKAHIAEIIAEFLEPGMFPLASLDVSATRDESLSGEVDDDDELELPDEVGMSTPESLISQREIDRFVKIDLQRIDDEKYFKKHFS